MATEVEGRIRVTGKDEASPIFLKLSKSMEKMAAWGQKITGTQGLGRMAEQSRRLAESLGNLTEKAARAVEGIGALAGIALAGSLAGVAESVRATAERLEHLGHVAEQLGVGVNTLRAFEAVAETVGISTEGMDSMLVKASETYAGLSHNVLKYRKQLEGLDPQLVRNVMGARNSGQAIDIMLSALDRAVKSGDMAKANLISEKLFGSADMVKAVKMGGAAYAQAMKDAAKHLSLLTDADMETVAKLNNSISTIKQSFEGVSTKITEAVSPALSKMLDQMSQWMDANRDWIAGAVKDAIVAAGDAIKRIDWERVGRALDSAAAGFKSVMAVIGGWKGVGIALAAWQFGSLAVAVLNVATAVAGLGWAILPALPALTLFGFAGYEIYKHWDSVSTFFSSFAGKTLPEALDLIDRGIRAAIPVIEKDMHDLLAAMLPSGLMSAYDRIDSFARNYGPFSDRPKSAAPTGTRMETRWLAPWISNLFGGGTAPRARALGGPVPAGGWSVVGERGPELVHFGAAANVMSTASSLTGASFMRTAATRLPEAIEQLTQVMTDLRDRLFGSSGSGAMAYDRSIYPGLSHTGGGGGVRNFSGGRAVPLPSVSGIAATGIGASGTSRAGAIFRMMTGLGIPPNAATGAIASLMGESHKSLDPGAIGAGGDFGIAQWMGPRKRALFASALAANKSAYSFDVQLAFLQHELTHNYARVLNVLRRTHSTEEAVRIWTRMFEAPLIDNSNARMGYIPHAERAIQDAQAGKGEVVVHIKPNGASVTHVSSTSSGNMNLRATVDAHGRRFNRGQL